MWNLFVGDQSNECLVYRDLTSLTMFDKNETLTKLIQAAYLKKRTGLLKDPFVNAWLIDRLRTGVGWESDIQLLNAEIPDTLKDISDFGDEGITETTLMICLLECFDSNDLASRTRLLHMMRKCNMQIPLMARICRNQSNIILKASQLLLYVGCLNYHLDISNNMTMFFGTDTLNRQGKDTLLLQLFPRIHLKTESDHIRSTTIELISYQDPNNNALLQLLNVNGSFSSQISQINAFAPYCSSLVVSIVLNDIQDNGQLNINDEQRRLLSQYQNKLIIIVRDMDQSTQKPDKLQKLWLTYNIPEEGQYTLNNLIKPSRPAYARIKEKIRNNILQLVTAPAEIQNVNLIELQVQILSTNQNLKQNDSTINSWCEMNQFIKLIRKKLDGKNLSKQDIFPFSHAAITAKAFKQADDTRQVTPETSIADLTSKRDPMNEYIKVINRKPSAIIEFFLQEVKSLNRMYYFERELNAWKLNGEVNRLRREIAEVRINSTNLNATTQREVPRIEDLLKTLDSMEWGILDIWRELRLIRTLIRDSTGLNAEQKLTLISQYPLLADTSDSLQSITGRFSELFFSGFTVDAIDGSLLEFDHKFMESAFRPNICAHLQGTSDQGFFVISVLGTQSTGKLD